MSSLKMLLVAGAAAGLTAAVAQAADLAPPPLYPPMPVVQEFSGWYLRGNIGMTNQAVSSLTDVVAAGSVVQNHFLTFDSAPLFGGGVGYQVNNWLRFDGTGEYRANAHFHGSDVLTFGGVPYVDDYSASKSEMLFLANAYVDLGTWWSITPFVGAGIGTSRNTISSFVDSGFHYSSGQAFPSYTYGDTHSQWNLAWALYAGLSYHVTPGLTLELAYRYVDLGSASTGPTNSFDGFVTNGPPFVFHDITSQDLMLGIRWNLGEPLAPPPPLVRKG